MKRSRFASGGIFEPLILVGYPAPRVGDTADCRPIHFCEGFAGWVGREGLISATLTSIMILVFLGARRSTLIICISIPLSIVTSLLLLSVLGENISIITLGALTLAVGVLVDDATVEIENMQRNVAMGKPLRQAIYSMAPRKPRHRHSPRSVSLSCLSYVHSLRRTAVPVCAARRGSWSSLSLPPILFADGYSDPGRVSAA
jgi:hypothetical protein